MRNGNVLRDFEMQYFDFIAFLDSKPESYPVIIDNNPFLLYLEIDPWESNILKLIKVGFLNAN